MDDVVGLRVVVKNNENVDCVCKALAGRYPKLRVKDYRSDERRYRSTHILLKHENPGEYTRSLEVQVRTLAQHLWAVESESFGEKVKGGSSKSPNINDYLVLLAKLCVLIDNGEIIQENKYDNKLLIARSPFTNKLKRLNSLFDEATKDSNKGTEENSFIVIYDNKLDVLNRISTYSLEERSNAIEEYQNLSRKFSGPENVRFEVLILNSTSKSVLPVTHPRFFPSGV